MGREVPNPQMDVALMFPSKYLKAADLPAEGADMKIVKVKKDVLRMADNTEKEKYTVAFDGQEKLLVLNKTNAMQIAKLLEETKAIRWPGRSVCLFPSQCSAFGATVDCIRVKGANGRASSSVAAESAPAAPARPAVAAGKGGPILAHATLKANILAKMKEVGLEDALQQSAILMQFCDGVDNIDKITMVQGSLLHDALLSVKHGRAELNFRADGTPEIKLPK